jgi:hypothetical protein
MTLGQPHPEDNGIRCDVTRRRHPLCTGWSPAQGCYIDWDNPDYERPKTVTNAKAKVAELATRVAPVSRVADTEGFPAAEEGSERAADRWTDAQKELVDAAIRAVAKAHHGGGEFNSDDIWDELAGAVPVTKGLTSRLLMAQRRGLIGNTGKTEISQRGGHHDHGQRLTVWHSVE